MVPWESSRYCGHIHLKLEQNKHETWNIYFESLQNEQTWENDGKWQVMVHHGKSWKIMVNVPTLSNMLDHFWRECTACSVDNLTVYIVTMYLTSGSFVGKHMTILILGERNTNKTSISWNKAIRGWFPPINTSLLKRSPQSPNSWGFGLVTPHHFDSTVAKPMRGGKMGHCRCVWNIANSLHHPEGFLKRWLQLMSGNPQVWPIFRSYKKTAPSVWSQNMCNFPTTPWFWS